MPIPKRTVIFLLVYISLGHICKSQTKLEFNPYIQHDSYKAFDDYFGRSYSTKLSLKGTSWGMNVIAKKTLAKQIEGQIGLGYYKYTFDYLRNYNSQFGTVAESRPSLYPGPNRPVYSTNKYWYNTLNISVGLNRIVTIDQHLQLSVGGLLNNYILISKTYRNSVATLDELRINSISYFGTTVSANGSLVWNFRQSYLGIQSQIPIFNVHHKDVIFIEAKAETRTKWLRGFGAGIVVGRTLH